MPFVVGGTGMCLAIDGISYRILDDSQNLVAPENRVYLKIQTNKQAIVNCTFIRVDRIGCAASCGYSQHAVSVHTCDE